MKSRSCGHSLLRAAVLKGGKAQKKGINQLLSNQGAAAADRDDAATHSNVAVRLDLIDPEAFLDQGARPAQ